MNAPRPPPPQPPAWRASWRALAWQSLAAVLVLALLLWTGHNAALALARRNIDVNFAFILRPAGFDIPFRLADWDSSDTYARALFVAGLNTLLASALAIIGATLLGLVLALMRLSANPLARLLSRGVIELVRNTPQLLQIVFWYFAVLQTLPGPRSSLVLADALFLNVRGLFMPAPDASWFPGAALTALVVALVLPAFRPRHATVLRLVGLVLLAAAILATHWTLPAMRGFNFQGGWRLPPELLALSLGIAIYTSAFVAENVRASIEGVARGQVEAARSLGLSPGRTMRLVVLPQALRTLLPPLTSQYLNVIKSTTLGAAIAYPEILQIYARTVLNQSGRAVEVMTIILGVFLAVNLLVSAAMNAWDRRLSRPSR